MVLQPTRCTVRSVSLPSRWALTPPFHPYPCGAVIFCYTCYTLTDIKPLACVALCVARTFLPLLPGGDGADLRGKGMNKSGIKVNLFMFYHAKIFGTQSGQGKILQGIRLPLLIGCRRQGYPIWCRLRLVVRERGFPSDCNYFIIKNNVFIVCLCENYYNCIGLFCINQVDWKMIISK